VSPPAPDPPVPTPITDGDGHVYGAVQIGGQRWLSANLRTTRFLNGDPIPYCPDPDVWDTLTSPAWVTYNADANYGTQFGKLYKAYVVLDPRKVCPAGWHIPSDEDWKVLETHLGVPLDDLDDFGTRGQDTSAGGALKALALWQAPNTAATDTFGFHALPGGERILSGVFEGIGTNGSWWSDSNANPDQLWVRSLRHSSSGVTRLSIAKGYGASIRCVADPE
jgi:uncharacterized protein (TIGR02145 family)